MDTVLFAWLQFREEQSNQSDTSVCVVFTQHYYTVCHVYIHEAPWGEGQGTTHAGAQTGPNQLPTQDQGTVHIPLCLCVLSVGPRRPPDPLSSSILHDAQKSIKTDKEGEEKVKKPRFPSILGPQRRPSRVESVSGESQVLNELKLSLF